VAMGIKGSFLGDLVIATILSLAILIIFGIVSDFFTAG
jgi:hypothetical protein